ncbi:MAG TPA: hypothetical protein VMO80_14220 [Terriglobales bacterium]|nr:hypothetical protein [Terriglobales bacterium]
MFIQGMSVAGQSAQPPQAKKASPSGANPPAAEPAAPAPPPAPVVLPPEQTPAHAPVIAWDGQLLTVDAENSSLSDVLLGIRSRTSASIEMPSSTSRERIAVHLGPAPIREVLSSLLYGTNFNYVIQSAEGDDGAVGKIILTARDGDQSGDAAGSDTVAVDGRTNPKMRLMPGYAAPGKRDFEVAHANAADDSASAAETPTAPDFSSPSPDQTAAATDSNATNQADTPPATAKATDNAPSTDATTLTAAEQPISGNAAGTVAGNGAASAGGSSALSQMEQNLQRMYQQRQQLQAQQGHAGQTPAP